MRHPSLTAACLLLSLPGLLLAQTAPTAPTTGPATLPARHLIVPPGFKLVDVAGRRVVVEPQDEAWARKAMTELAPATKPTTAPADILERLAAVRPELTRQMVADLALPDASKVDAFFDQTLLPTMAKYRDARPPMVYLATTHAKLLALVKGGWEDPRYYYNRAADEVMIDTGLVFTVDRAMDDMLLPALYREDAPEDSKKAALIRMVQGTERIAADEISRRAQVSLQVAFITFIVNDVLKPLNLKTDQDWLGMGVSGVLSARYACRVTGQSEEFVLKLMTFENPRVPVKGASIDLMHPADLTVLRDRIVPFYLDAMRRRSMTVVREWVNQVGEKAIPETLKGIRAEHPADGQALVKLIKEKTGVDLTDKLKATPVKTEAYPPPLP